MAKRADRGGVSAWTLDGKARRRSSKAPGSTRAPTKNAKVRKRAAKSPDGASEWLVKPKRRTNGSPKGGPAMVTRERRLDRANRQLRQQEKQIERLQRRIDQLEGRDGSAERRSALGSASFEELREAGLSVTQAAKFVAYREANGGLKKTDDLKSVPGLSKRSRELLLERFPPSRR